ncbi:tRNA lysidine(34) synthetase TilS [Niveispirillum lacus]|uniref:tRNA(Ile)-lysidine synthase n=1 Tax=Niveispirillum lacus TaxID=1981099 RepID=A0A255YTX0_9PROT|nr:tRNA lysidine(34) synthetase TilS [Niveispirillum lacus]OYQ32631.1 tRNA lysidine(34) synthetase TilS [Niveispirillum lacus]
MQVSPPIEPVGFDRLMRGVGPFESAPQIAVGVSGGADSVALTLLLARWVGQRGGRLLALTVDHGLRADSHAEAAKVAAWMANLGIEHRILPWVGEKPTTGIQAGARHARLRLLADAAAAQGILHLALAHHADDQAETHRLRADRASGSQGLAGMPAIREMDHLRLIRPLLPVAKARLVATCQAWGQAWVEDPSNGNPAFARARLRLSQSVGANEAQAAQTAATARAILDGDVARLLAMHARFQPEGWVVLNRALLDAPNDRVQPLVASLLRAVGGAAYPPSPASIADLLQGLREQPDRGRTLAGCRFMPLTDGWRLLREARNLQGPARFRGGGTPVTWDGRFRLSAERVGDYSVRALDDALWRLARADRPDLSRVDMPASLRWTLPAVLSGDRLIAIPHLLYTAADMPDPGVSVVPLVSVPAVPARFAVVTAADDII